MEAWNELERYAYQMRSTLRQPQVRDKVPKEQFTLAERVVNETMDWLQGDTNKGATHELIKQMHDAMVDICHPLLNLIYK